MTHSAHMMIALIKLSAGVIYLISLSLLWRGMFGRQQVNHRLITKASLSACSLHLLGALLLVFSGEQIDFSLFVSGSLIFAVTSSIITLSSLKKPVHAIQIIIQPICIFLIAASLLITPTKYTSLSTGVSLHILSSILAYGLITIAAAAALVLTYFSYRLKHKHFIHQGSLIPPLETLEKLLFEMILAGEVLLSLSILSGFIFVDDIFGQKLIHKTFFSILSWAIFATLIAGHHYFGWRGARAMKLTITGFAMLLLAYVGSKMVLEMMLG